MLGRLWNNLALGDRLLSRFYLLRSVTLVELQIPHAPVLPMDHTMTIEMTF